MKYFWLSNVGLWGVFFWETVFFLILFHVLYFANNENCKNERDQKPNTFYAY